MADPQDFLAEQVDRFGGSITDPPGGEVGQRWRPDTPLRRQACEAAMRCAVPQRRIFTKCLTPMAEAALARGDPVAARDWADDTVAVAPGWHQMVALNACAAGAIVTETSRNRLNAIAMTPSRSPPAHTGTCMCLTRWNALARRAFDGDNHQQAARLFGAAAAVRQRNGEARFAVFQADYDRVVAATRDELGQKDFD